jgi:hypothetical protein
MHRANLEKMEEKELAVVLHHLDQKKDTARRAVSEISMLQAQLMQQVGILHPILHTIHFSSLNVIVCLLNSTLCLAHLAPHVTPCSPMLTYRPSLFLLQKFPTSI